MAAAALLTLVASVLSAAPPAQAGVNTFVSDDFHASTLDARWSVTDPQGDSAVTLVGSGTEDARLSLAVPAGTSHDAWIPNQALRVTEPMTNTDFGAEVKFDSVPSKRYQSQGVLVQQDANTWVRADYYSDGTNLRFFTSTFAGGTATVRTDVSIPAPSDGSLWLRMGRSGTTWTTSSSTDGSNWTTRATFTATLTASSIGVFAGNASASTSPAFTALVDYLFNTASPISPEDPAGPPPPPDTTPPQITGVSTSPASSTTSISWTTDEPTTSRIDYGTTTSYGANTTDANLTLAHTLTLTGLNPSTTYYFTITATDASGNAAATPGFTFTTTAAPTNFTSDDFHTSTLDSRWTVTDPVGNSTVSLVGSGTSDARLSLAVPAGTAHDAWVPNQALRVTQPMNNTDFGAETKFDSVPSQRYQMQGMVVQQDANNWLRADYYSDGTNLRFFTSTFTGGTATVRTDVSIPAPTGTSVWIRVSRTGSTWTISSSADGSTWTTRSTFSWSLAASGIGVFAGNAAGSTSPSFTALVDYLFNSASPISPEDPGGPPDTTPPTIGGTSAAPSSSTATVSWTTNETTTSRIDYGTTASYGSNTTDANLTLGHSLTIGGLAPSTLYHYKITATDAAGNATSTSDATFTTTAAPTNFASDDFHSSTLDSRWSITNPQGDGTVALTGSGTGNARLSLGVPANVAHDAWSPNQSLRVTQPMSNTDFGAEIKFDSVPTQQYQQQGILVQQDASNWVRADYYSNGSSLRFFTASFSGGTATVRTDVSVPVPAGGSLWLRVSRTGSTWTTSSSSDGVTWTTQASFSASLTANSIGAFAGNATGTSSPAFTALVDYLFNTASPIAPEDPAGTPNDTTPPTVSGVSVTPTGTTAQVRWTTNENADSRVDYGLTTGLGSSATAAGSTVTHSVLVTGLTPSTTYHFKVRSADGSGNVTTTNDATFTTNTQASGPVIDVWYGPTQSVGLPGLSQRWVNVLGNVSGPRTISSLSYRLNGGASRPLSMGPNLRRLVKTGDFNIDILVSQLQAGTNTVVITAVDSAGITVTSNVTVTNTTPAPFWPFPTTVDWGSSNKVTDNGVVVDGKWYIDNGNLRTREPGYDRLVGFGDQRWTDYEVSVPVTVHSVILGRPWQSGPPLMGLIFRWNGFTDTVTPGSQPQQGYLPDGTNPTPFGALLVVHWNSNTDTPVEIWNHRGTAIASTNALTLQLGTTYIFKGRVQTLGNGQSVYSIKVWQSGTAEPGAWTLQYTAGTSDYQPSRGSVLLDAHESDVSFGDVTVTNLAP
jgi:regulation of enolase protein 1 (concanavalin A-like superfamily)